MKLIYFIGNQGSGKTTQSENLVQNHGFKRISLAQPIRRILCHIMATYSDSMDADMIYVKYFTEPRYSHYKTNPVELDRLTMLGTRKALEGLGEGAREEIGEQVWVQAAQQYINTLIAEDPDVKLVTDDTRRPFEERAMKGFGGFGVFLNKPGSDQPGIATEECQMYVESHQMFPDIQANFDMGIKKTTKLVESIL